MNKSLVSDGWLVFDESRSQIFFDASDFSRSIALRHVDQEEKLASAVELVETSSSRELCVATVTLFPLSHRIELS